MKKLFALFLFNLLVAGSMHAAKEVYAVFSSDANVMEVQHERYTFIGWSKPATNITDDLTVIAQYEKKTETDLNDLHNDNAQSRKLINNGTLYILRNGNTYTLQGQQHCPYRLRSL